MIWGEPNREPELQPLDPVPPSAVDPDDELTAAQQVAPRNYAVLLDTAYEALKREGPSDLVIGGNTYTSAGTDNIRPYPVDRVHEAARTGAARGWTCGATTPGATAVPI